MGPWIIISGDFTPLGGMDRANHALAKFLAKNREVHVVAHRVWPDLADLPNVRTHLVPRPFGSHFLGHLPLSIAAKRIISKYQADGARVVVNGGNCGSGHDMNWLHIVHSAYEPPASRLSLLQKVRVRAIHAAERRLERAQLPAAKLLICNSQKTADDAKRLIDTRTAKVEVVYLGVDPQEFSLVQTGEKQAARERLNLDDRPHLLFAGQLQNSIKNFDTLFDAFCRLRRVDNLDLVLLVAGVHKHSGWQRRIDAAGFSKHVRLLGFRTDIAQVIAASDAIVFPSRYDAYGLAAHEAICRGLPAIVSFNTGIAERFPATLDAMILRDVSSERELAERIKMWHQSIGTWIERFRPLSNAFRSWTWDDMSRRIEHLALEFHPATKHA